MYTVGDDEEGVGVVMDVATGEGVLMTWRACWNFIGKYWGRYWGRYWRWNLACIGKYGVFVGVCDGFYCKNVCLWRIVVVFV